MVITVTIPEAMSSGQQHQQQQQQAFSAPSLVVQTPDDGDASIGDTASPRPLWNNYFVSPTSSGASASSATVLPTSPVAVPTRPTSQQPKRFRDQRLTTSSGDISGNATSNNLNAHTWHGGTVPAPLLQTSTATAAAAAATAVAHNMEMMVPLPHESLFKRRRHLSYHPPRQIPKTLISTMGTLATATGSMGNLQQQQHTITNTNATTTAAATGTITTNAHTATSRVHLRRQLSGSNLVEYLVSSSTGSSNQKNDDMEVEDTPERPRSMSF
jgi:hypothetical protein